MVDEPHGDTVLINVELIVTNNREDALGDDGSKSRPFPIFGVCREIVRGLRRKATRARYRCALNLDTKVSAGSSAHLRQMSHMLAHECLERLKLGAIGHLGHQRRDLKGVEPGSSFSYLVGHAS